MVAELSKFVPQTNPTLHKLQRVNVDTDKIQGETVKTSEDRFICNECS
jgi:hypothetical protein